MFCHRMKTSKLAKESNYVYVSSNDNSYVKEKNNYNTNFRRLIYAAKMFENQLALSMEMTISKYHVFLPLPESIY